MGESCSISLDGSTRIKEQGGWTGIVEQRTKELNLNGPSEYIQYLIEQDIYRPRDRMKKREIVMYSIILLTFFAIILQMIGVI
jgi:hypothetical protein